MYNSTVTAVTHSKLFPKQILQPLFLLQPAYTLNLMLALFYLCICIALGGRRNSALAFLINTLKMMLHSVFGFALSIGGNFMVATMIIFFQVLDFSHALLLEPLKWCFPNIEKSDYYLLSVCLSVQTEQFVAQ